MASPAWLTERRLSVYAGGLALLLVVVVGRLAVDTARGRRSSDFVQFVAASTLAREGTPEAAYDLRSLAVAEERVYGPSTRPVDWLYPPPYFFAVWPLASLPYAVAWSLWLALPLTAVVCAARRCAPHRLTPVLLLTFPAVVLNVSYGQNAFLTAALLGWALLLTDDRPCVAGVLAGLAACKPHMAALLPVAWLVGRRWRALAASVATGLALVAASVAWLGVGPWLAWADAAHTVTGTVTRAWTTKLLMPTAYQAALLAGCSPEAAGLLHAAVALCAVLAVAWVWRRGAPADLRAGVLATGALLVPPYLYEYDLVLLALPMAWLGWRATSSGLRRVEAAALGACWLLPLAGRQLATHAGFSPGPLVLLALLGCLVARAREAVAAGEGQGAIAN